MATLRGRTAALARLVLVGLVGGPPQRSARAVPSERADASVLEDGLLHVIDGVGDQYRVLLFRRRLPGARDRDVEDPGAPDAFEALRKGGREGLPEGSAVGGGRRR